MLSDVLSLYVNRLGFDCDFRSTIEEVSEDYIDVTDPDLNFDDVRAKILKDKVLSRKLVNQSIVSVELFDSTWDGDGNKINADILFSIGSLGFGTRVRMMVKTIDAVIDGSIKSFLSIESYNNYLKSKSAEV